MLVTVESPPDTRPDRGREGRWVDFKTGSCKDGQARQERSDEELGPFHREGQTLDRRLTFSSAGRGVSSRTRARDPSLRRQEKQRQAREWYVASLYEEQRLKLWTLMVLFSGAEGSLSRRLGVGLSE